MWGEQRGWARRQGISRHNAASGGVRILEPVQGGSGWSPKKAGGCYQLGRWSKTNSGMGAGRSAQSGRGSRTLRCPIADGRELPLHALRQSVKFFYFVTASCLSSGEPRGFSALRYVDSLYGVRVCQRA